MATHHFEPSVYYTALGTYEPVLHIESGDTVVTTTVDNAGRDSEDQAVTRGGNPQTGPFYIEDAVNGDTLAVHFDRIVPNRRIGRTATVVAPNVLDPYYVAANLPKSGGAEWEIDVDRWTATLISPETRLGKFCLPLEPMVGCFGVAAIGGQAISTATSAEHGGNMDYRGFCQGATVYLPVFAEGALFFLGDGHAVQGDGEIVGTGVEISFDIEFTVTLIKGKRIHWPRGRMRTTFSPPETPVRSIKPYSMQPPRCFAGWWNSVWRRTNPISCSVNVLNTTLEMCSTPPIQ